MMPSKEIESVDLSLSVIFSSTVSNAPAAILKVSTSTESTHVVNEENKPGSVQYKMRVQACEHWRDQIPSECVSQKSRITLLRSGSCSWCLSPQVPLGQFLLAFLQEALPLIILGALLLHPVQKCPALPHARRQRYHVKLSDCICSQVSTRSRLVELMCL